jgi:hypothetical protein
MEIREFDVIKVGDPLSALLACLDKNRGMTVTGKDVPPEAGNILENHGDPAGVKRRLDECEPDWRDYLRPR